jgi:hypothetical protein
MPCPLSFFNHNVCRKRHGALGDQGLGPRVTVQACQYHAGWAHDPQGVVSSKHGIFSISPLGGGRKGSRAPTRDSLDQ